MLTPALAALAADTLAALTPAETDAEISAALAAAGVDLPAYLVAMETTAADAVADHLDGFGIRGVITLEDGRVVESPTWTAAEIKRRHAFHRAGIKPDDRRHCFDSPEEAERFINAVDLTR